MGPLIPLFWTSGGVCPGFQSEGGFITCTLSCLHAIPQIHLWCDICDILVELGVVLHGLFYPIRVVTIIEQ